MEYNPVRALAASALANVLRDGSHLSSTLHKLETTIPASRDSALIQELCYGSLRYQPRLEFWLAKLLRHPLQPRDIDIHALLLLGLYQLTSMRIPAHAVLMETADACRQLHKEWAVKVVNAVLRRFQREQATLESGISACPEALYAHPRWFIEHLQADWPAHWQSILEANNQHPPFTLRVNRRAISRDALLAEFSACAIAAQPCRCSTDGLVLSIPMHAQSLPGFASGKFSVQDEAAQLAAELLEVQPGMRVLDACAAPGGKTCHVLERYPAIGELVAVDIEMNRIGKIRENLRRLGLSAQLIQADALCPADWWDGRHFQRILLDAPCSATGVIRRHPDIKVHRSPQDVGAAAALQARLLAALWPLLAAGGKLLYVTCSVLREENVDVIHAFLDSHADAKLSEPQADWGVHTPAGRQILTGQDGMDGFFYACIEKQTQESYTC